MKTGRNDPCHCGSGNKYKKCCLAKDDEARAVAARTAAAAAAEKATEASTEASATAVASGTAPRQAPPPARSKGAGSPPPLFRRRAV